MERTAVFSLQMFCALERMKKDQMWLDFIFP